MRSLEITFFGLCTLLALIGGVVTVAAKNPIRGAMGLLVTIIGIAGMYLLLSAELLAAIQIVVYAGAVVILFLFVIMLLGPSASEPGDARGAVSRYAGAGLFVLTSAGLLSVIMRMGGETLTTLPPAGPGMGTIEVIGREIFTKDVVPFEISGVLLLIAVIGAVAVARSKHSELAIPTTQRRTAPPPGHDDPKSQLARAGASGGGRAPSKAAAEAVTEVKS
jgi:NADH-quinone oxidoreductase subunit J